MSTYAFAAVADPAHLPPDFFSAIAAIAPGKPYAVVWFVPRDYDSLWDTHFRGPTSESLGRIWRDCGLFSGDGTARPALGVWREWMAKARR